MLMGQPVNYDGISGKRFSSFQKAAIATPNRAEIRIFVNLEEERHLLQNPTTSKLL